MQEKQTPKHVAIIMDGNGRWADKNGLPRSKGHQEGAKAVKAVLKAAKDTGVKYITLYAFSCENWSRPKTEIAALMKLLKQTLKDFSGNNNKDIKLIFSGRRDKLPADVLAQMDAASAKTAHNTALTLNLALNYGARQEITDAFNKLAAQGKTNITEDDISAALYSNLPDPDLIIRTSGEERLSNFLLWQAAYSEFYFTPVLWPDFKEENFKQAIKDYCTRDRRFGGR